MEARAHSMFMNRKTKIKIVNIYKSDLMNCGCEKKATESLIFEC